MRFIGDHVNLPRVFSNGEGCRGLKLIARLTVTTLSALSKIPPILKIQLLKIVLQGIVAVVQIANRIMRAVQST